ncbi:MAG: SDR family NAD(P)-dependent oxidoreductase, partial [Kutzneria sp.]|nr:SDR family NAD(P)-dependent oxidoreductase [Kutzneria sp.]
SVKSQIGHTKCASGLAGLIKTALALYHGIKPPTLHVSRPNPAWRPQESPFTLNAEPVPWPVAPGERVAGVSAFGFGGTNFHVVLTGYTGSPAPRHSGDQWPAELFVFRGADHRAACRSVERLLDVAAANEVNGRPWRLRDLAKTASLLAPRSTEPVRIAVVAATLDDLTHLLRRAVAGEHDPESGLFGQAPVEGKLAFLFPGQGSQHTGMLAELFVAFPEAQHLLGLDDQLTALIYPPAAFDKETRRDNDSRLRDTRAAQPALGIAGLAINHLLGRLRIRPDMLAGHSYGELVALSAAGSFGPTTLLELSRARAESIIASTGADPGAMAAVSATAEQVAPLLTDQVVIANYNGPDQVVISGPTAGVERAIEVLRAAGHSAKPIPVACAFHSAVVAGAGERFGQFLSSADIRPPELPVWGNRTAREYGADVRTELVAQIGAPVGFVTQVEAMYAAGARIFVEVGPGAVLTRLVASILGDRPHVRVPTDGGLRGFLCAVAQLAVCGIPVSTGWLFDGRDAVEANADDVPKRPGWTVDGHLVRTSDGSYLAGGLAPARRVEVPMTAGHGDRSNKDALISEYLRTSRELIAAQRDVLLSYFGGVADAPMRVGPTASAGAMAEVTASGPPIAEVAPEPEPAGVDVLGTVLNVISERTGYPVDMIDPGLDLEADLSIDSIKRTEIAGCLVERLRAGSDVDVDELAKVRTARALADLCAGVDQTEKQAEAQPAAVTGRQPRRFQLLDTAVGGVDAEDVSVLNGSSFVLVGGSAELRDQLTALLTGHGAALADIGADRIDGLIYLEPLTAGDDPVLPQAYPLFRSVLGAAPRWVFAAAPADDRHADRVAGLRGFFRTLSREYPDVRTRLVEIECGATTEVAATTLLRELLTDGARPVVRYIDGVAHTVDMVAAELGSLGTTGAGPAGDGTAEVRAIGLDRESVVLLVGGARGITARLAATLALTSGCRIELVGRTRLPAEREDPATAGVADRAGLRAALAGLGHRSPAEVDRLAGGILAAREVAATVAELRRLGSPVRYHSADVLDADGLHRVVKEIHADHGRLDGVVYAAGVIEDKLVADKDHESFRRVFNTKVDGVRALLEAVDGLPSAPGFTILFGSIAATLGNRGQIDYS